MERINFSAGPKSSGVSGAATRRRRYLARALSVLALLPLASAARAQNTISTVAGSAPANNVSPTGAPLVGPQAVVRDGAGNLYVVNDNGVIYKVTPGTVAPSNMTIFAGNNTAGFSPNGTAATSTLTFEPYGAALDANGNLYYSDSQNCVVREITGGVVKTIAGNGNCGFSGDGNAATSASLGFLQGIALDGLGNLFIADAGNAVVRRVVLSTGIITTYAGTPDAQGFPTSGAAAISTPLAFPAGVAADANGNLFIADEGDNVVCRVDATSKILTIVAGTGAQGFSGDGGPATSAMLNEPDGVAVDSAGNIYISDTINALVREVFSPTNQNTPNQINTIVGNGTFGFSGDGGPALSAELTNPAGLFVDSTTGNLWIADFWANRIRLYTASSKTITTVVGSGLVGDGGAATSASFYFPRTPQLDSQGNLYIVDAENDRIRKVDASGNITTVVGSGIPCARPSLPCGDGGPAASAQIFMPRTVTIEANGDLLVSDDGDNRIREVSGGNINTIVGSGGQCGSGQGQVPLPCGDGGPALQASVNDARGAVRDAAGNLYFVDAQDNRVREVAAASGTITTIAGGGTNNTAPTGCGNGKYTGDGGPAVNATLDCPLGLDIDAAGNLYVADTDNNVIRKIDTGSPRIITTIAGNGTPGHTGDGGLATSATLNSPDRVSVNGAGNFFISDSGNNVIRRVDGTSKIITAFAGNGNFAFAGDNGPALSASFATPVGVVVTPEGNMYVGDVNNNRIRKVLLNPNVALSSNTAGFANQPINVAATPLPVTVTNSGDAPLTISSIALTGASVFSLGTSTSPCPVAPATLAVGATCVIDVAFTPTQFAASTGTITITDNGPTANSTQIVNVSGTGAAPLTVSVTGTGTVTSVPAGISCPTTCTANFAGNSQVTLTAVPAANFTFGAFSTDCTPTGALTCVVTMSAAETVTATFTPSTGGGGGGLTIGPSTLPNGAVGSAYGQILVAAGGIAPFNFSISSGALPAGLTIGATTGSIAGVPTGPAGPATFTVKVTDSSSTPLTGTANFTITIAAADSTNNSELNGSYAFLFQGFNDSDGTMVVVAGSFVADGHGNILPGGFEDADGSTGAQPTQELSGSSYTIGADNRGSLSLTTPSGTTVLAISVGEIQAGVATKARFIRFDDVSGTNGHTGSGVILKQDPSIFALAAIKGSYAFGETGSNLTNGSPESGVGFLNADGNGNFTPAGLVDLNDGGRIGTSKPLSGIYQLTDQTVSSGRLSASVTLTGVTGSVTDVIYIVSQTQFIFISINSNNTLVYSGIAELQVPPANGFDSTSLSNNSVVAMQGKLANGSSIALIGSLATDGNGIFTLSYLQNSGGTSTTATAGGTYVVDTNGRAQLTYTSGGFSPTIIYLDGSNQGFAAASDANASSGPLDPGLLTYSNATLSASGNFFFGTIAPTTINDTNQSGVASFAATTVQSVSDGTAPGGILLGDETGSQTYSVGTDGQLTFIGQGVVGYVANGCKFEVLSNAVTNPVTETVECQQTPTNGSTLTVTEVGTGTVTSNPTGISCPTTCSAGFTSGSQVVLTATPTGGSSSGSLSASFSANCTPANPQTNPPTCTVTMTGSPTVTVTFTGGSAIPPALGITKSHTGNFTQGQQGATYTVTVSNGAGAGPTSGTVTVTDTIPAGLTLVSMAGTGWTCAASSCTRSDALVAGASYPVITVTVNVASNAAASVTNSVSVSGGGSATASTTNPTTITTSGGGGGGSGIATVTPTSLAFGGVQVGNSSALSFTLKNTGTGALGSIAISVVTVTDASFPAEPAPVLPDYAITSNTCPTSLAVGSAPCTVTVTFTPTFLAADPGSVVITDDSSAGSTTVLLSGTGAGPVFVLPFEIFYDGITPGSTSPAQTATVFSTDTEIGVTGVTIVGNAASDFSVTSNGCGNGVGQGCPIGVAFTPSTTVLGPRTADLTIATNADGNPSVVSHLTGNGAIRHLTGFTANVIPPNDDGSTTQINLPFAINFFGTTFNSLFVNNNGNVTFGTALSEFTPSGLNTNNGGIPIIAPFWADVDTSAAAPDSQDAGSPPSGVVTFGVDTVNGHQAFGVNYENVGYFSFHSDKLNSFQLILIDRSDTGIAGAFDMEFNYDKIQWEAGDASDGSDGLCGDPTQCAAVGYSNGTGNPGTNFQLPGSFTTGALLDNGPAATSLIHNSLNNTMIGRYLFQVRNGTVQPTLTVAETGTGTGTVTSSPAGINCQPTCSASFPSGTAVTLTATPADGSTFTGWSGGGCTGTSTCVVTITTATAVTANFALGTSNFTLTVTKAGTGTGTVTSSPAGINCGATCSSSFTSGQVVVLTAAAASGSTFAGWSGAGCTGTSTCSVTMSAAETVTATFNTTGNNFTLTVTEAGTGTGNVSSAPAGINCQPACSAGFASGTVVALTATASEGSTFAGWSGAGCTGTGGCSVTMTAAQTVTATFNSGNSPVTIGLAPGSPSTVNTTPGSSAIFGLTLTALPGTTGTVTLGCTSTSPNITCNIVPSTITLTGKTTSVAIVVNTFCKGAVPGFGPSVPGGFVGGLALLLASMLLCGAMWTFKRRPRLALSFGVLVLMAVGMSACSSLPKSPGGQATQPGLYPLVVTATAPNGAVSSVNLTLNVLP
ncbi:MAG TPA: nidogen-like domain-containing protein [Candidatus Acidoferrales bacterium]|nr:nidogen-like domain-containing protein [Candidatus Acidoferrales bacterium]